MTRLSHLNLRNLLIALHDLLATTAALLVAFYLRFEGGDGFFARLPLLFRILPYFLAFSVVVFFLLNLTTTKWRFISLPDALNIIRAATVLTVALLVLDYIFLAPNVHGTFFLGKVTIIREACDLVITAATHALGAARSNVSVYVLNMGQPVKIVDLAERMIRPSGLQPGYDIEIVFTGMRPGERLNEILFASEEPTVEIGIAGIMAARPNEPPMQTLRKWIAALEQAIATDDPTTIRSVLKDAIPEFKSNAAAE